MSCDAWLHYDYAIVTRMLRELFPRALSNRHAVLYLDDEQDSVRIVVTCVNAKLNLNPLIAHVVRCGLMPAYNQKRGGRKIFLSKFVQRNSARLASWMYAAR